MPIEIYRTEALARLNYADKGKAVPLAWITIYSDPTFKVEAKTTLSEQYFVALDNGQYFLAGGTFDTLLGVSPITSDIDLPEAHDENSAIIAALKVIAKAYQSVANACTESIESIGSEQVTCTPAPRSEAPSVQIGETFAVGTGVGQ